MLSRTMGSVVVQLGWGEGVNGGLGYDMWSMHSITVYSIRKTLHWLNVLFGPVLHHWPTIKKAGSFFSLEFGNFRCGPANSAPKE